MYDIEETEELSFDDRVALETLLRVLEQVHIDFKHSVPVRLIRTFLAVSLHEGASMGEIAALVGSKPSTASRDLLDLGARKRNGEPGYGFIEQRPDPVHLRRNAYTVTPKGQLVLDGWERIMEEGERRAQEARSGLDQLPPAVGVPNVAGRVH